MNESQVVHGIGIYGIKCGGICKGNFCLLQVPLSEQSHAKIIVEDRLGAVERNRTSNGVNGLLGFAFLQVSHAEEMPGTRAVRIFLKKPLIARDGALAI